MGGQGSQGESQSSHLASRADQLSRVLDSDVPITFEMRPIHGTGIKKSPVAGRRLRNHFPRRRDLGVGERIGEFHHSVALRGNLQTVVTTEEVKEDTPPPPPPPDFKPPPVNAIAPEVTIDLAQAPPPAATTAITNTPPKPPAPGCRCAAAASAGAHRADRFEQPSNHWMRLTTRRFPCAFRSRARF